MAIDSNGIYHYTAGDVVNSWPAFMNLGMSSVSTKFAGVNRNYIYTAANQAAADALRTDNGSSAASPLFVFRTDTKKLMFHNGSAWSEVIPPANTHIATITKSASGSSVTLSALKSATMATIQLNLPVPCSLSAFAVAQARPGGNAAGTLEIYVDGAKLISQMWHSQSSSHHQWPSIFGGKDLVAGDHTVTLVGTMGVGSTDTTYAYQTLSVTATPR